MATNKINVVEKTPGTHIEYALSGSKKITFGMMNYNQSCQP